MRLAALGLEGLPTLVVDYDAMMAEPGEASAAFGRFLEQVGVALEPGRTESAADHLDPALSHQRAANDEYEDMSQPQTQLFDALIGRAGPHESWVAPPLPPAALWVEDVLRLQRKLTERNRELKLVRSSWVNRIDEKVRSYSRRQK
jgi:hypothetical protein